MTTSDAVQPAVLGLFYEDFVVGTTYQHPFGRTISEADSTWFTLLTCNTNQNHLSQNAVANLGWSDIKLTHPVYIGDTLYAESICLEKRESSSRPELGIIRMKTRGLNQDGDEIVSWFRSVMIPKRTSGIGQNYFPTAKTGPLTA